MIGKLTGKIDDIEEDSILLNVQDVGYIVYCTKKFLKQNLKIGDNLSLYIFSFIREDAHKLFGFLTKEEKQWFILLRNVQKVGPKHAMAILGEFTIDELGHHIVTQNSQALVKAPGIGKTLAEKIIYELQRKSLPISLNLPFLSEGGKKTEDISNGEPSLEKMPVIFQESLSALINLGYNRDQSIRVLQSVLKDQNLEENSLKTSELVRLALKAYATL